MKSALTIAWAAALMTCPLAAQWDDVPAGPLRRTWSFRSEGTGDRPFDFAFLDSGTGDGPPGRWLVTNDDSAPDGSKVLSQVDGDGRRNRYSMAVVEDGEYQHARLRVKYKVTGGKHHQACGIVARVKDPETYYLARVGVMDRTLSLYAVVADEWKELGVAPAPELATGRWGELGLDLHRDRLILLHEGKVVLSVQDSALTFWGRIGLWTESDTTASFDRFHVDPLAPE